MFRFGRSLASLLLIGFSGCAIYTPYAVERHRVDWNTERQLSCQIEKFDHLPPKVIRVRLMRWGYNIGPAGEFPKPVPRDWGGRLLGAPELNGPRAMWNEVPPTEFAPENSSPPVPHQPLPLIPPAPPADLSDEFGTHGASSEIHQPQVQAANHQSAQSSRRAMGRSISTAGWIFSTP